MSTESVKGLIISERQSGESDKYLTVLTEKDGVLTLLARGAKKPKSKFMSVGIFSFGEFFYFKGNGFNSLNSADIEENFFALQTDYEKLAYASFVLEAASLTAYGDTSSLLQLVLYTLTAMAKTDISPKVITCAFRLKLLHILGLLNAEEGCVCCEKAETDFFSAKAGGFVCSACRQNVTDAVKISGGTKRAVMYIAESSLKKIFSFNVSDMVYRELNEISDRCMREHIKSEFKTDKIIKTL